MAEGESLATFVGDAVGLEEVGEAEGCVDGDAVLGLDVGPELTIVAETGASSPVLSLPTVLVASPSSIT